MAFRPLVAGLPPLGEPGASLRQWKNTGDYDVGVRFNRHGLRDARDVATAGPDDVLALGDSFTFGWGVEEKERFGDRLEALTGRRVFNVAVSTDLDGYARLLAWARSLGARPGHVVVGVCMENDLRTYREGEAPQEGTGRLSALQRFRRTASGLWQRTALRGLVTTAVHASVPLERLAVRAGLVREQVEGIGQVPCDAALLGSSADQVREISRGVPTTVLLIPSRGLWIGRGRDTSRCVHDRFVAALVRAGLDVVDPRLAFEATGNPLALHFAGDPHWTPRGHDIVARLLAARLGPAPGGR